MQEIYARMNKICFEGHIYASKLFFYPINMEEFLQHKKKSAINALKKRVNWIYGPFTTYLPR